MNLVTVKEEYADDYPWPTPILYMGNVDIPIEPTPIVPPLEVTNVVVIDGLSIVHFVPLPEGASYSLYFDNV